MIIMSMITRMSMMTKARAKVDTFVMMMVTMMSLVTMMTVRDEHDDYVDHGGDQGQGGFMLHRITIMIPRFKIIDNQ